MTAPIAPETPNASEVTVDDLPEDCQNKEAVVFLLKMMDKVSKGTDGPVDAILFIPVNTTVRPPAIGLVAHKLDAAASRVILSVALDFTKQAETRTRSGIILPGH